MNLMYRKSVKFTEEIQLDHLIQSVWRNGSEEIFSKYSEKYVTNLFDITLNKLQLEALSLGFKFSVPCPKVTRIDVESQFEYLNSQLVDLQPSTKDNVSGFKVKMCRPCQSAHDNTTKIPQTSITTTPRSTE